MTRTARPLLAALALALLAGTAAAQAPPPAGGARPPAPPAVEVPTPPPAGPARMGGMPGMGGGMGNGMGAGMGEGGTKPGGMMGMMHGRAAHLRFEHGNVDIDVKCAEDEATKACVDAIMPLVERLGQMPAGLNESPRYR